MNYTPKGKALTKLSLAIDQGKSKDAMWLTVTSWEALAEQVNVTVNKGDLVEVRGRLSVNKYNDRYYYEVIADSVEVQQTPNGKKKRNDPEEVLGDLDDHPF